MANKKKTDKKTILFLAVIGIILVIAAVGVVFSSRNEKVNKNPSGTIGGRPGNINNNGLFAECDGTVFFSNSFDGGALYSMTPGESDVKRLTTAVPHNLLAAGDYVYFFQVGASGATGLGGVRVPRSFIRMRRDGSKAVSLVRETITKAQLVDNTLFMQGTGDDGAYFFRIDIDKANRKDISKVLVNPASARNGTIYYNGTDRDHNLYSMNASNGSYRLVLEGNIWNPTIDGDWIYYMDPGDGYRLYRYSLSTDETDLVADAKVEGFNVGYGYVYYQTFGDNPGLYCAYDSGEAPVLIANGSFNSINITSQYVYFKAFGDDYATYHSYLGSSYYEKFSAAESAAIATQEKDRKGK